MKFALAATGVATCALPPANISLRRTAGTAIGLIDESVYEMSADTGTFFRISGCQYLYNLASASLGPGTYQVGIRISGVTVGSATFALK